MERTAKDPPTIGNLILNQRFPNAQPHWFRKPDYDASARKSEVEMSRE
jgi:hypothetical protein